MVYHTGNHLIDPRIILQKARVHDGMHIADFGCGRTGHVVFPGSKLVGDKGVVYAVDILKDVLESIRRRAQVEAIHNVETIWADLEQPQALSIAPKTLDVAFFVNMLFHFPSYDTPLDEAARILKDKGRIVVVDWTKKVGMLGPGEDDMVRFGEIEDWAMKHNFVVQERFDMGQYHRGFVLFRQH